MSLRIRSVLLLAALTAALGASIWAQRLLRAGDRGLPFFAGAFALAFIAGRLLVAVPAPTPAPAPSLRPTRPRWLIAGLGSIAIVLALQHAGSAPLVQIGALLVSLVAWVAAYLPRTWTRRDEPRSVRVTQTLLLSISLVACLSVLDRIPGGLYGDEGSLGTIILNLLNGSALVPPFAVGWAEVPTLYNWMEAAGVAAAGSDIGGLRLVAAIGGALAVLPWFGMLRRELGLVAAAGSALFLCASPAHQHLSRIALPESWIRLCAFAALGALYVALCTGRAVRYVVAGVSLGCCFYMASKAVLLPPIMVGGALFVVIATLMASLSQWRGAVLVVAAAVLAFLPELVCYAGARQGWHDALLGHTGRWMETPYPGGLASHAQDMFRLLVDRSESSPFSPFEYGSRIVSDIEGALFIVGLGVCMARPRRPIAAFVLGWLVAGFASLWLDAAPNQVPHALLISCLPAAFAAIVLHALQDGAARISGRPLVGALVAAICAAPLILWNGSAYFGRGVGAGPWSGAEFTALGSAMQEHRDTHHVALVTPLMSWDLNSTLLYLAPGFHAPTKLTALDPNKPWFDAVATRDVVFLVSGSVAKQLLPAIRSRYPDVPVEQRKSPMGDLLLAVVRVPAEEVRRAEEPLRGR